MFIAMLYIFFGLLALWFGYKLHKSREKVRNWSRTNGKITHREVSLSTRGGLTKTSAFRYESLVKYAYSADGRTYEGDRIYPLGWVTNSYKNRKKFIDKIPDEPIVHYDPKNPSESCLLPPSIGWVVLGYGMGTVIVLLGGVMLLSKL